MKAATAPAIVSPDTVLAHVLSHTIDLLRPKVESGRPSRLVFVVGAQISGAPHIGTNLVQTAAFLMARLARRRFAVDSVVRFAALDNTPHDVVLDPETHHAYQQTVFHALGQTGVANIVNTYYHWFLESLSDATDSEYEIETYTQQQASESFRRQFLRSLSRLDDIRWWLAPSHGGVQIRIPCPECGWAEKRAERTQLVRIDSDEALFTGVCFDHGVHETAIGRADGGYVDLDTIYRNLIKELALAEEEETLYVMVKGGDWTLGPQLVDGALLAMGTSATAMPVRVFAPQVLDATGAKLSKSVIRKAGTAAVGRTADWLLDTSAWNGSRDDYVEALIWLVERFLADPKHFLRSYTTDEVLRLLSTRPGS